MHMLWSQYHNSRSCGYGPRSGPGTARRYSGRGHSSPGPSRSDITPSYHYLRVFLHSSVEYKSVFSPIWIRFWSLKTRIGIRPIICSNLLKKYQRKLVQIFNLWLFFLLLHIVFNNLLRAKTLKFYSFRAFFHGSWSGLFADPDPNSGISVRSEQKDPDPKHWYKCLQMLPKVFRITRPFLLSIRNIYYLKAKKNLTCFCYLPFKFAI